MHPLPFCIPPTPSTPNHSSKALLFVLDAPTTHFPKQVPELYGVRMSLEFGKPRARLCHWESSVQLRDGPQNMCVLQEEVSIPRCSAQR